MQPDNFNSVEERLGDGELFTSMSNLIANQLIKNLMKKELIVFLNNKKDKLIEKELLRQKEKINLFLKYGEFYNLNDIALIN